MEPNENKIKDIILLQLETVKLVSPTVKNILPKNQYTFIIAQEINNNFPTSSNIHIQISPIILKVFLWLFFSPNKDQIKIHTLHAAVTNFHFLSV